MHSKCMFGGARPVEEEYIDEASVDNVKTFKDKSSCYSI